MVLPDKSESNVTSRILWYSAVVYFTGLVKSLRFKRRAELCGAIESTASAYQLDRVYVSNESYMNIFACALQAIVGAGTSSLARL